MKKNIIIFLVIAPLLGVLMTGIRFYYLVNHWSYEGPDAIFNIEQGEQFSYINQRLYNKGFISSPKLFYQYCKKSKLITKLKVGTYNIKTGMTMMDIIDLLSKGKGQGIKITIQEGKNIYEIAKMLEKKGITNSRDFLIYAKNYKFMQELGIPNNNVEGYLYPDTYNFSKDTPAKKVIKVMLSIFNSKTKGLNFSNTPNNLSKHQIITLASIVEKETGAKDEMQLISGVFHNRIKISMRLQSDPTAIYGIYNLKSSFSGNLRRKDLLKKTAYNTYRINSIPPGPISNPGIEAIKATLNPAKHDYLYFVSKNNGTHTFSKTYKEHKEAVIQYQKSRKYRHTGRSWRNLEQEKRANQ